MKRKFAGFVPLLAIAIALYAATAARAQHLAEYGTAAQQSRVRTSREASLLPLQATCNVNKNRELFITDLSVVEDCFRTTWTGTCAADQDA